MKIFRSILGVVIGVIVAMVVIGIAETINSIVYKPDDGKTLMEWSEELQSDKQAMKAWIESVPLSAMVTVLLIWDLGGFLGGGIAALISGFARLLHAGIVGAFVLLMTAFNFYMMKQQCDVTMPDWFILLGLLLPIPASLLAGKLVSMMSSPSPVAPP